MDIISKREAIDRGLSQFFTGLPCKHGHISPRSVLGHNCTECRRNALSRRYEDKKTEICKQTREWFQNNPVKRMLIAAKNRAKSKGLIFNLEFDDIVIPTTCPVLGIPLHQGTGQLTPNSPSLDRIDSTQGYTKNNVIVISYRANSLKKDATVDEMNALATFYTRLTHKNGKNG